MHKSARKVNKFQRKGELGEIAKQRETGHVSVHFGGRVTGRHPRSPVRRISVFDITSLYEREQMERVY